MSALRRSLKVPVPPLGAMELGGAWTSSSRSPVKSTLEILRGASPSLKAVKVTVSGSLKPIVPALWVPPLAMVVEPCLIRMSGVGGSTPVAWGKNSQVELPPSKMRKLLVVVPRPVA